MTANMLVPASMAASAVVIFRAIAEAHSTDEPPRCARSQYENKHVTRNPTRCQCIFAAKVKNKFRCEMKCLSLVLALAGMCTLELTAASPAFALETYEAKMEASDAASQARVDMLEAFGPKMLRPGQYLWRDIPSVAGPERVVISLSDQLAYLYRGSTLMAVSTISSGKDAKPSPTGIFSVLDKRPFYRSKKYDNAPMPWMQRIDQYGIALHGGFNPGYPASHGCVRLPVAFAKKLYSVTDVGTPVYIGA